jgi:uncharacterized RDD family membrane protein YckC
MTTPPVPPSGSYPPDMPPPVGYPPAPPMGGYPPPPPMGGYPPPPPLGGYPPYGYPLPPGAYPQLGGTGLPPQAYTSWITRVAAYFIDLVPVVVLFIVGQALLLVTATKSGCVDGIYGCRAESSGLGVVLMVLFSLAAMGFSIWNYGYRQGTTGSSVGKSVMKFKVVGEVTGQPIGFGMSIVRQLAHIVDGLICNLGYLFPLWDSKRQTLADKIMSTVCLPV